MHAPVNFARDPEVIKEENILNIPSFSKNRGRRGFFQEKGGEDVSRNTWGEFFSLVFTFPKKGDGIFSTEKKGAKTFFRLFFETGKFKSSMQHAFASFRGYIYGEHLIFRTPLLKSAKNTILILGHPSIFSSVR